MKIPIVILLLVAAANAGLLTTLVATLRQESCTTLSTRVALEVVCNAVNTPLTNAIACNTHCQCAHGAIWGQCTTSPASPTLFGAGDYCACYYTQPPAGVNPSIDPLFDPVTCPTFRAIGAAICSGIPLPLPGVVTLPLPTCAQDCICSHNAQNGTCPNGTSGGPCICTY